MAQELLVGQGILMIEVLQSRSIRHATLGVTLLDEWPAWRRIFYLTTHNAHKRQKSVLPGGFRTQIAASEQP